MSSNSLAICVQGLSKNYTIRRSAQNHITLAELALSRLRHPLHRTPRETLSALKNVSFDVQEGEVVGIVGRNGAGKSTLLRLLTRVTEPTTGRITLWGRVGSLLEVGTGFHPELTGRENVFLNGSILGMKAADIRRQFDAIVAFAGIEQFLDTPVKRYSSGMYVRLAFAVAAHLESEILLIDEVLAVGDADFQSTCLDKLSELAGCGRTILLSSHSAQVIKQVAPRALLLASGSIEADGNSAEVLDLYAAVHCDLATFRDVSSLARYEPALGTSARIRSIQLLTASGSYEWDGPLRCLLRITASEDIGPTTLAVSIHTLEGVKLGSCFSSETFALQPEEANLIKVTVPPLPVAGGRYSLSFALSLGNQSGNTTFLDIVRNAIEFELRPRVEPNGLVERWDATWGPLRLPAASACRVAASDLEAYEILS